MVMTTDQWVSAIGWGLLCFMAGYMTRFITHVTHPLFNVLVDVTTMERGLEFDNWFTYFVGRFGWTFWMPRKLEDKVRHLIRQEMREIQQHIGKMEQGIRCREYLVLASFIAVCALGTFIFLDKFSPVYMMTEGHRWFCWSFFSVFLLLFVVQASIVAHKRVKVYELKKAYKHDELAHSEVCAVTGVKDVPDDVQHPPGMRSLKVPLLARPKGNAGPGPQIVKKETNDEPVQAMEEAPSVWNRLRGAGGRPQVEPVINPTLRDNEANIGAAIWESGSLWGRTTSV